MIIKFMMLLMLAVTTSGCSAPKPPKISSNRNLKPVNFNSSETNDSNIVIRSEQTQGCWNKQFIYSSNNQDYSPEFYYAVAHADKIIVKIKPPFIDFTFRETELNLRSYGVTAQIELFPVEDEDNQDSQIVLECVKYKKSR